MAFTPLVLRILITVAVTAATVVALLQGKESEASSLTHVFIPFVPVQKKRLLKTLSLWAKFLPCSGALHPFVNVPKPHLVFLVSVRALGMEELQDEVVNAV